MAFLPFSDYQDVFLSLLPASMLAAFAVPAWILLPAQLLCLAKAVYPPWCEHNAEWGGHRIIPMLNVSPLWFSSSDTTTLLIVTFIVQQDGHQCFRGREIKSVWKTHASQAFSSDKLFRLQVELAQAHGLAKSLLERKNLTKDEARKGSSLPNLNASSHHWAWKTAMNCYMTRRTWWRSPGPKSLGMLNLSFPHSSHLITSFQLSTRTQA